MESVEGRALIANRSSLSFKQTPKLLVLLLHGGELVSDGSEQL